MKNILSVLLLVLVALWLYIDVLFPLYTERQQYDNTVNQYMNGIAA